MKVCFFIFSMCLSFSFSQTRIGEWDVYMDYSSVNCLFANEQEIYVGTESQFFTYNETDNSITSYSKLSGLNDTNITAINVDPLSNTTIIGYENGNIDLMFNNQVVNIPFIKNSNNLVGSKKINNIHVDEGIAFLACDFGLVKLNISNYEILDTYYFWNNGAYGSVLDCFVFNFSSTDTKLSNKIYVATDFGLFSANKNNPNLLDPNSWENEHSILNNQGVVENVTFINGVKKLIGQKNGGHELILIPNNYSTTNAKDPICQILTFSEKNNFFIAHEIPALCNNNENIISAHIENGEIMGFSYSKLFLINNIDDLKIPGKAIDNLELFSISPINLLNGFNSIVFKKNESGNVIKIYFGDTINGLTQCVIYNGDFYFENYFIPNGPASNNFGDIAFIDNKLIIAHGGKNGSWNNLNIKQELSIYENNQWRKTSDLINMEINDLLTIAGSNNNYFVGSWNSGLIEFSDYNITNVYNEKNSSLQTITDDGWIRIGGCCEDLYGGLWVTNSQAENPISLFENESWQSFSLSSISTNTMIGKIVCASNNQKWIQSRGEGIVVISNNNNSKEIDEKKLNSAVNFGNLPSNIVNSIIEDADGSVWVGTANGVGVFYFPNNIFNSDNFDCETPLVEVDGYVERLLYNTNVLDIDIDGGNRKWFATEGKGVFLMSENGTEEIYHFTSENSPLLSNVVNNVEINPETGDVFFGTDMGLCSFRSNATLSQENFENVLIFPNPVKRNYSGFISINGLTNETNVKITDVSGNLVYETYSEGGRATWDGKNFSGKKVKTGVYLFFCTNNDFNETVVKKILIYN